MNGQFTPCELRLDATLIADMPSFLKLLERIYGEATLFILHVDAEAIPFSLWSPETKGHMGTFRNAAWYQRCLSLEVALNAIGKTN